MACASTSKNTMENSGGWSAVDLLLESMPSVNRRVADSLVGLFASENTVPFIARYRGHLTGNMDVGQLRTAERLVQEAKEIKKRSTFIESQVEKSGKLSGDLKQALVQAKSLEALESLYAPYKPENKQSLAARARALNLEVPAMKILNGTPVDLEQFVTKGTKGLSSVEDVSSGVQHVLADYILRQSETQEFIRNLIHQTHIRVQASVAKSAAKLDEAVTSKYQNYFNFDGDASTVKPHQLNLSIKQPVLALNRGEETKVLKVKVSIGDAAEKRFTGFCRQRFRCVSNRALFDKTIEDCFKRLAEPQMSRAVRSSLTKEAEVASACVFGKNLKELLLTPPVADTFILGIDPGFSHGCKTALLSNISEVILTGKFFLPQCQNQKAKQFGGVGILRDMADVVRQSHESRLRIAIGNGTACRETEEMIGSLITKGDVFHGLQVEYCIVNESGASIYSVTEVAIKDLPNLEPNLRSAVSIARRLQDPLAELVKIEPKHIGVGMYQHDINQKELQTTLDSIVEECVSFVGVDVNTCSQQLLQRVAGLNKTRAAKILERRLQRGRFTSRQQLLDIAGIGPKTYQQAVGFIFVYPSTSTSASNGAQSCDTDEQSGPPRKKRKRATAESADVDAFNPLDATMVHPESYQLAETLIGKTGLSLASVGTAELRKALDRLPDDAAVTLSDSDQTQNGRQVIDALKRPLRFDYRQDESSSVPPPLFRVGVRSVSELHAGVSLTGAVTNVTHFGAFVDVGVGRDGLVHSSQLPRGVTLQQLQVGARLDVIVLNVDQQRKRISLKMILK